MSTLIKDLGAVSAYAYAVEKGYTGTEDEFASLMYDYTDVIQIASEARDGAVAANASAQEAKTEAQTASSTANEAANKATSKASEASASVTEAGKATNAAVAAKTAAETAQQRAETAQQASEDAQRKAEIAKNEAQENATIANNKASKASQYATTATNKASEASTSAKNAKTYSEQSQASATTANTKADEASASANSAKTFADNAQQSATNAQTYMNSSSTSASKAQANAEKTQSDKEAVESAKSDVLSAVDNAQNYANSAQSASQAIQNMDVEVTTLEPDSDATVEKTVDATSGAVTLTYGIPKGQVGEKGDKGDTGDSGVYIGASAPSDENVNVWIDSDGEPDDVIQIDGTLTQSGQAADAKKTGDEITSLKADIDGIKRHTKNLADIYSYTGGGISLSNGVFVGTGGAFNGAEFVFNGNANTQYRVSFDAKTGGNFTTSGSGLKFRLHYTDDTASSWRTFANSDTSYTHYSLYSAEGKTIDKLQWSLSTGVSNIWYVKNLQIELGTVETTYEYPYTARDKKSESEIAKTNLNVNSVVNQLINATNSGYQAETFELGNISIGESGWTYSNSTTRVGTKEGTTIHLNEGDVIGLTSYANARYYLGWITSDSTYGYVGWLTRDWTISTTGDYVILLCHASDTTLSDKNELLQLLFIKHRGVRKSLYEIPWCNRSGMRLHAHRGLIDSDPTSDYVENSIPSFERAGKNQMFICETDLNVTSDGHFVCMHDGTVDRTTNGSGNVSDMTLAQVRALKLLKKDGTTSNLLVPTLEEYLTICRRYNMVALFEIKGYTGAKVSSVMEIVKKHGMKHQCCIAMSYTNMRSLRILTSLDVPAIIIATDSTWSDCYDTACAYDYTGISYSSEGTITQAMIQDCHDNDIPFDVWIANTVASADNYFDLGVDIVTTDILTPSDWLE